MSKARVVIADDDSMILMNLREELTELGYQVVGDASDAQTAIDLARMYKPDVVLLDARMPDSRVDMAEGIRAASELAADGIAPCVLLTGFSDENLIAKATEAGVFNYLVKPIRTDELAPAIEVAISRFRQFRELRQDNADLKDALETQKIVAKAKGVLMEKQGLTEDEAYQRIRKASMDSRRPMRQIAEAVLLAEEVSPGSTGASRSAPG
ncbi:MAG: response regulator [Chloroflexi bacterium]|nr:response regulator [Chloroflexota bacterium]